MKAKTLKQLISQIPDEEEVYYSEYDRFSEEYEPNNEFKLQKYRDKNGEIVSLICGPKPNEFKEEAEFARENKWAEIVSLIPKRKNWQRGEKLWGERMICLEFKVGSFVYPFHLELGREKSIRGYVGDASRMKEFDSWEEFFAAAEPVVIKAAQKQREELESLLVD